MLTKFERARRQTIQYWKPILYGSWLYNNNQDCCFCYYYKKGTISIYELPGTAVACRECPVNGACRIVNGQLNYLNGVNRAMAVLLWLMSDDCKSLDDGSR